jgi:hypothetical protein
MKWLLPMLLFTATAAQGEIFTWKDARGTSHYTNSRYEIPERYRERAKVLDLGIEKKTDAATPPQPGQLQQATPAPAQKAPAAPPAQQRRKTRSRHAAEPEE